MEPERPAGRHQATPGGPRRPVAAESGSHDQVMDLGGRYAELFTLQASAYLSPSGAS
jgi:hypothetical protein